jgi:tetratricopeptide (TPR) repeat protein
MLPLLLAAVTATMQPSAPVTFTEHVAPIVFRHCASCHRPDGPAPFSLLTYEDVRQRATLIADVTRRRYMPPWKPDAPSGTFVGERRLADVEIGRLNQWAISGAPKGDPARLPPMPKWAAGWQLGEPDLVVSFPEYTLRADGLDVFRNFVLPIPGPGLRYVRGVEFRPGSSAVHHANIRIDYTRASRRMDENDPGPGYVGLIARSADYPDGHFLGWTPGQFPPTAPKGLAWRLAEGADFVVQLHMRPTGKPERVQPTIGLFFTGEVPSSLPVMLRLGRQNIDIPAGEAGYRSIDEYVLPVDAEIHALQPHSHYRATTVRAWAALPDGSTRSLISIPEWDFGWQDVYRLADPFWLPAGTRLHTEYVFDNSTRNRRNPESPPKRARWGFRSSDEMGDVWIQAMTRSDTDRARLAQDYRRRDAAEETVGYEMQLTVDPDNVALHDDVAMLYLELGKPHIAAAHFEASLRLRPASAVAVYNLGTAREAVGRVTDATALFREAIRLDPNYAPAHVNLGNMLLLQGRAGDALGHYREAVRVQPDNADARNNLGRLLFAQGQRREGIELLQEAVRLQPTHVAAHFNLGAALIQETGDAVNAVAHFREAMRLRPDWTPSLLALSWVLSSHPDEGIRRPDEAVQLATRAADLSSRADAAALDAQAAAYAAAGRFDDAVTTATLAAELASRAAAKEQLAQIQRRLALYQQRKPYVEQLR